MPTNLLDLYEASTTDQMQRVKIQSSGQKLEPSAFGTYPPANFNEDTFQKEFRTRRYGDKVVIQSTIDDSTEGTFQPRALNYYSEQEVDNKLIQYRSQLVHVYSARNLSKQYSTINAASRGVLSRYGA